MEGNRAINQNSIIIDSGTTSHMFPTVSYFEFDVESDTGSIETAKSGVSIPIMGRGTNNLLGPNCLLVPQLSNGLISIAQLDRNQCSSVFTGGKCVIRTQSGIILLTGTLKDNLYLVDDQYVGILTNNRLSEKVNFTCIELDVDDEQSNHALVSTRSISKAIPNYSTEADPDDRVQDLVKRSVSIMNFENDLERLHYEMGHLSESYLKRLIRNDMIYGIDKIDKVKFGQLHLKFCPACFKGRMKAMDRVKIYSTHNWDIFNKVAVDYKGPFPIMSEKANGFFLFSDYASNYVYPYFVNKKSKAKEAIEEFYLEMITANQFTMKILQSDYDTIFIDKRVTKWLLQRGIHSQLSAPYKHSQNGQIERDMQSVMDKARTLMAVFDTPHRFWKYAVQNACDMINMSPTFGKDKTPHEMVYKVKPNISHLVPFWSPGVYHVTKEERSSKIFPEKARPCRCLGYDKRLLLGYVIYDIQNRRIIRRADCIFNESINNDIVTDILDSTDDDQYIEEQLQNQIDDVDSVNKDTESDDEPYDAVNESNYCVTWDNDMIVYRDPSEEQQYTHMSNCDDEELFNWSLHQAFKTNANRESIELPQIPSTVEEALDPNNPDNEKWCQAIIAELLMLKTLGVFEVAHPDGRAMR